MKVRSGRVLGLAVLILTVVVGAALYVGHSVGPTTVSGGWMVTTRYGQTATRLSDGRVLIAGGFSTADHGLAAAEIFDPKSGTFTSTGSMMVARVAHTATLLPDGRVLVTGGLDLADPGTEWASAELYDPNTGTFHVAGSMSSPRSGHTATLLSDGEVLIAGDAGEATGPTADLFDPKTSTFRQTGSMITPRDGHSATLLNNGEVLIVGGSDQSLDFLTSAELYDPKTGTFRATGSMETARLGHTATLLAGACGCVLVAGGYVAGSYSTDSAEIYDPATGMFRATGSMSTPRTNTTATALKSGKVLVAGGAVGPTGRLSSAELYDPVSGQFQPCGPMVAGQSKHTATLLEDGRVLIAGGTKYDAPAQLFNPQTATFGPVE
jgi:hypothetical protein